MQKNAPEATTSVKVTGQNNAGNEVTKETFRRLLSYVNHYRAGFIMAIIGMLGYAGIDTLFISQVKPFIDDGITNNKPEVLTWAPLFVIVVFMARGVFNFTSAYCLNWVGSKIVMRMRQQLFEKMLHLPVSFHDQNSSGELISKITYDTEQIQLAASKALLVLVREGAIVFGLLFLMFYHSWRLSLVFLILAPFIAVIVAYVSKRFRAISRNIQDTMGDVTRCSEQMIKGHKVILGFGGQDIEKERFAGVNNVNRQQKMKLEVTRVLSVSVVQVIASLALATVLYIASFPSMLSELTPGTFTVIVTSMMMLLRPLKQLTNVNSEFQRGMSACASVFAVLDQETENDCGSKQAQNIQGHVELKNVRFTYPTKSEPIFTDINLSIPAGQTVALVGRSGSGKSTISNLLVRLYELDSGVIALDDTDITEFQLTSLREQFATVSQHVILFNDTIANNIAYGYNGEVTEEKMLEVARQSHVLEFVNELPDGLNTVVGENGVMLSGGQRQRIAIARALLRDAPVLILDEATSALDSESEKIIQSALTTLLKGRTSIVIAHRLSTIENADKIVVVDKGRIIEEGTHQALIEKGNAYAALYKLQYGE